MSRRLTKEDAISLRYLARGGASDKLLAFRFKVSQRAVRDCRKGITYANAGGPITKHHKAFSDDVIVQVRNLASDPGVSLTSIASQYGMSLSYVSRVVRGLYRKDVGGTISAARNEYFDADAKV